MGDVCAPHVKTIEKALAFGAVAGGKTSATCVFQVKNPSVRLHLTLLIYARPSKIGIAGNGGAPHDYTGEAWQLYVLSDTTPDVVVNWVFDVGGVNTPRALPDSYEVETGAKSIEGVATLLKIVGNSADTYFIKAIWEAAAGGPEMTDDERDRLFSLCELETANQPVNLSC